MRPLFFFTYLLFFTLPIAANNIWDPLLAIVLMVKNEEKAIQVTLQPFLDVGINAYLILDTGSTDNTIQVTQDLFKLHAVKEGYIVEQPFVDFATSRNYALRCAEEKFPNAAFFLMIDAEWIMCNVSELLNFCREHLYSDQDSYLIRGVCEKDDFFVQRLIRPKKGLRYTKKIHEKFNKTTTVKAPSTIYFNLLTTHYGMQKTRDRWLRDLTLLEEEFKNDPKDGHTIYYLGQTYAALGNYDEAIKYFTLYCERALPDEFSFMVHWRLAELYQIQNHWEKALYYYLKAYNIRPTRAEPLINIASYYLTKGQFILSFFFAIQTLDMPYPKDDIFFIVKDIYEYARYDIIAKSAFCIGQYEIGEKALNQALKVRPGDVTLCVVNNAYLERKILHD